jgi:hypothetical protein
MKKTIFIVLTVLLMLGGIGAGVYLVQRNAEYRERAAPASTLTLSSSTLTPKVGQEIIVTSGIDTGNNQVIATETYITYDKNLLDLTRVELGSFFVNPEEIGPTIDNDNGIVSYTQYLLPGSSPQTGQGALALMYFTALAPGTTTISYNQESIVGAVQEDGKNVLAGTTDVTLTISEENQQITPSPTEGAGQPTDTPTPTPTATPTGTDDGGIGGESDTPTPTPTATPTQTSDSGSSATNTPTSSSGSSNANPTSTQELLDTGVSIPTLMGIGLGILVLIGSVLVAF